LEYDVAILQALAYLWSLDMGCRNSYEPIVNLIVYLVVVHGQDEVDDMQRS
jgi:hypothetical protein